MDEGMSAFCIKASAADGTGTKCGRWNPTTEQVKVLTELFRSGLRTPSTDQIQKISTQLSFYGKIESKNVFYWFQNHKARERQKRRKVSISVHDDHRNHNHDLHHHQHKDVIRRMDKISSLKHFVEVNHHHQQVYDHYQPERVMKTLQLFPLNSFEEYSELEKPMIRSMHANHDHHPPLDLRLSFL
ncbi:hypothetical protein Ddye_032079 [Dipteronia dyeriana]|uniref:Homeobox domain-containing protein n=1 Tax=Dipteronia dyeriana TaxID=168575 RepID=A0AAD9TK68_9ROSI|nr:hypothetical protein Ddye_032079 [Dipteronia dyeriana]